jgi:hypothetical protein
MLSARHLTSFSWSTDLNLGQLLHYLAAHIADGGYMVIFMHSKDFLNQVTKGFIFELANQ